MNIMKHLNLEIYQAFKNLKKMKKFKSSKIEKTQEFFNWLHEKIKTVHVVSNEEFENIIEKL